MPPELMMLLSTLGPLVLGGLGGKGEQHGSTYSKGARSAIDQVLEDIKTMKGSSQDIQQNPNYQTGENWLQSMFNDPDFFKNFEAPLQRQFEENTIPDLANRFAAQGSGGALGSTGFRNQLAREGSNLHTNIAALRGNMQQQGANQLLNYAQQPFQNLMQLYGLGTTPTQNTYQGASSGPLGNIAAGLSGGAATYWGNQMAGQNNPNAGQSPSTQGGAPVGGGNMYRGYPGQY